MVPEVNMCTNAPSPPTGVLPANGSAAALQPDRLRSLPSTSAMSTVQAPSGTFEDCAASAITTFASAPSSRDATASAANAVNSGT